MPYNRSPMCRTMNGISRSAVITEAIIPATRTTAPRANFLLVEDIVCSVEQNDAPSIRKLVDDAPKTPNPRHVLQDSITGNIHPPCYSRGSFAQIRYAFRVYAVQFHEEEHCLVDRRISLLLLID